MSVSGEIHIKYDGLYEWKIGDFLSVSHVKSPRFFFKDIGLVMEVSVFQKEDRLQIAIYNMNILSGKSSPDLFIDLGMDTFINQIRESRIGTLGGSGKLHFFRWMPWTEMLQRRCWILGPLGSLTISCCVTEISPMVNYPRTNLAPSEPETVIESGEKSKLDTLPTGIANIPDKNEDSDENSEDETCTQSKGVKNLLKSLRSMLTTGEDSDVVINVRGKEFRAHRSILRARSSVFKSMFSHDMLEKNSGAVNIDDCDPDTFPDFLDHIYTGNTDIISKKNVFCLYKVSDKYDIETLKEECVEYMKENMTVDSFCHVITLAVKYNEKELIKLATEFFCFNSLNIIQTVEWQTFLKENATVGNELFIKLLSK